MAMADRTLSYFVSDVHLGLDVNDPAEREARFVRFLRSIPKDRTRTLYMLGDIWDFWYEYHDVVPKGYVRVFAALMDLMDAGVEVCFSKATMTSGASIISRRWASVSSGSLMSWRSAGRHSVSGMETDSGRDTVGTN